MRSLRYAGFMVALGLACGGKDETTATGGSASSSSEAGSTSAEETAGETTGTPTTGGSTGEASTSSSGGESSTGEAPACETAAEDCGISVDEVSSVCVDPPPVKNELVVEVLGPGKLKFTEIGYDSACNVTILPEVLLGPKLIVVNYMVQGNPDEGCICKFSISATLSGVPSGAWTVSVGPFSQQVDVP